MLYKMKLNSAPFIKIRSGKKTVELRLYDEKRQKLKNGDKIEFTNIKTGESLVCNVKRLHIFPSFEELYEHFDKISIGYDEDETADFKDMEKYYSKEDENKYGTVGIEIELM